MSWLAEGLLSSQERMSGIELESVGMSYNITGAQCRIRPVTFSGDFMTDMIR